MSDYKEIHLIPGEFQSFIIERRARHLTAETIEYYSRECGYLIDWLKSRGVQSLEDLTAAHVREYLADLSGHRNQGGVAASWRAIKAFFSHVEREYDGEWKNVMRKVPAPKTPTDPLPGIPLVDFQALLDTCASDLLGLRDRSVFLLLLDTGVRRNELLALNIGDVNMVTGECNIRHGKGDKRRSVYFGVKTRRALARYLRKRGEVRLDDPLIAIKAGTRMSEDGLRQMIVNRARRAHLKEVPSPHDFRRAFALQFLKNGGDVFALQRLMGHSDLTILRRYLAQSAGDIQEEHQQHGPVDNLK